MDYEIIYILATTALMLNLIVSVYIARRDDLDKFQKIAQIVIVWLIPYLSAIGIWLFHRSGDSSSILKGNTSSSKSDNISVGNFGE